MNRTIKQAWFTYKYKTALQYLNVQLLSIKFLKRKKDKNHIAIVIIKMKIL